jgi:hypothetical protein
MLAQYIYLIRFHPKNDVVLIETNELWPVQIGCPNKRHQFLNEGNISYGVGLRNWSSPNVVKKLKNSANYRLHMSRPYNIMQFKVRLETSKCWRASCLPFTGYSRASIGFRQWNNVSRMDYKIVGNRIDSRGFHKNWSGPVHRFSSN